MTDPIWTPKLVAAWLAEAARTMRKLPRPRVAGFFSVWPEVVRSDWDACAWDGERPGRGFATPSEVTRMEAAMLWLRWLERDEQKIVWARANRTPWKVIAYEHGMDRTTAWRRWTCALVTMSARLNGAADRKVLQHFSMQQIGANRVD